jgi:AcrR family transcriptional regulator
MVMAKKGIDQRILRTQAKLQHALNSLIPQKGYEAITIKDICEAADVGRSTFYVHYTSKDDLKRSGFEPLRKLLFERQREALSTTRTGGSHRLGFSLAMFEHARDHKDHYRALVGGRGGAVSLGAIRTLLSDLVRAESIATAEKSPEAIPHALVVQYIVGAFMAVMTWWLDGGAKIATHRIDAMFRRLAIEGMPSSFAGKPSGCRL